MRAGAGWVAFIAATLMAAGALAQSSSAPDTALPPMTEPPVDVPMHVPQPPRDSEAPATPQVQAAPAAPPIASPAAPAARSAPAAAAAESRGGTITPIAPRCREATYRVIIDGHPELAHARVCRLADGRWRIAP